MTALQNDLPTVPPADRGRADRATLERQRAEFLGDSLGAAVLEAVPGPVMVVNDERQILCANSELLAMLAVEDLLLLLGQRPGEALHCLEAANSPGGCDTGEACGRCGALDAYRQALANRGRAVRECRITTAGQGGEVGDVTMDLRVHASYLAIDGETYVLIGLQDIDHEKRRQVLERAFFHDLLNTCGGLQGLAEVLSEMRGDEAAEAAYKLELVQLSRLVVEEIRAHQQMFAAEHGDLQLDLDEIDVPAFLQELIAVYRNHVVRGGRQLRLAPVTPCRLRTDPSLLRRILGNLIKNALEATDQDATIEVGAACGPDGVTFAVRNPGTIAPDAQRQIFQRSFTTKAGAGRGVGTYAVRLFAERYLGGKAAFESTDPAGTAFYVTLPHAP